MQVHKVKFFYHLVVRVATAQGKQGIWFLLFPDRENTGNFAMTQGKYFSPDRGKNLDTGKIFDCDYYNKQYVYFFECQIFF